MIEIEEFIQVLIDRYIPYTIRMGSDSDVFQDFYIYIKNSRDKIVYTIIIQFTKNTVTRSYTWTDLSTGSVIEIDNLSKDDILKKLYELDLSEVYNFELDDLKK